VKRENRTYIEKRKTKWTLRFVVVARKLSTSTLASAKLSCNQQQPEDITLSSLLNLQHQRLLQNFFGRTLLFNRPKQQAFFIGVLKRQNRVVVAFAA
jgi:hypothetical protein